MAFQTPQALFSYLNSGLSAQDIANLSDADLDILENLLYHWREMAAAEQNRRHAVRLAEVAK